MRQRNWLPGVCAAVALAILGGGCAPADRYNAGAAKTNPTSRNPEGLGPPGLAQTPTPPAPPAAPPMPGLAWSLPLPSLMEPQVRLEFVTAADNPKEWAELKDFWMVAPANPSFIGLPPLPAAMAAAVQQSNQVVKVKVPRGLDDPTPHIPPANPPTLGKWALGKQLFFDESWLQAESAGAKSCANCHQPDRGFANPQFPRQGTLETPTLINTVYNTAQFWDGRAGALEEVVQRSLQDERSAPDVTPARAHVWSGVVERLRRNGPLNDRFVNVFGTLPTQDAIGKALATYMRTILSGNSVHDQALQAMRDRKANKLEAADYEKALAGVNAATLKVWEREGIPKPDLAKELHAGWDLFTGKARCIRCHSGANFTDNGFHNLGVADSHEPEYQTPGNETGRFAALPIGLKDPRMIGAYKTPTLRDLPDRRGFFHNGLHDRLFEVVWFLGQGGTMNPYLDPEMRDEKNPNKPRNLDLKEGEARALVLFMQALEGEPIDPVVREPEQQRPEAPM